MKITSWNVNGIRAIEKKGFLDFLNTDNSDIFCAQETKAHPDQLGENLISPLKYQSVWSSAQKKGYSGTLVYSKNKFDTIAYFDIERFDSEGRVIVTEFKLFDKNFTLINAYFPNSQEAGKRLDYKIDFCEHMLKFCNSIHTPLILCGDYNIAHTAIDLARPDQNEQSPGYLPEERAWMTKFLSAGYIDSFRKFNPDPHNYTWWSYRGGGRERNVGWRIDYFCHNSAADPFIKDCIIQNEIMGSDHCPISLYLKK